MTEIVRIRSADEYFTEYGRDGIGKGVDKWMIRGRLMFQETGGLLEIDDLKMEDIYDDARAENTYSNEGTT